MRVVFGLKVHSGWAALVTIGARSGELQIIDRRRLELAEEESAKQPYHAAEHLELDVARAVVRRGVEAAYRIAAREMHVVVQHTIDAGHEVTGCAVLTAAPMRKWSVDEILAVHFRMHKAEGVLFRDAIARAAEACGLRLVLIPEKQLDERATRALGTSMNSVWRRIAVLGKSAGPPWSKDQKEAALAALLALEDART